MTIFQLKIPAILKFPAIILLNLLTFSFAFGQTYMVDIVRDSARSDQRTGGVIEKTGFAAGVGSLKITANIPAFQMTLWQDGREVKNYPMGVGLKEFPMSVGLKSIDSIIWNPAWIPPDSEWVSPALRGVFIAPTDPRNPLGKIKIPLGYGYLIHQAKGTKDLGNLVSHGCMRVLQKDLYDLNEKVVAAFSLDVSDAEISKAKNTKETFVVELAAPLLLEITYDTIVVEAGNLHIYPDVYEYKKNTVENLRKELQANNVDDAEISDAALSKMLAFVKVKKQYVVSLEQIRAGGYFRGKVKPVL